ncbi:MAG: DUF2997 domain-containing protein [Sporichthyaceae bacterium]
MGRRLAITVNADGTIDAESLGVFGKDCLDLVPLLERLLDADTVSSSFTDDYYVASHGEATATAETVVEQHDA